MDFVDDHLLETNAKSTQEATALFGIRPARSHSQSLVNFPLSTPPRPGSGTTRKRARARSVGPCINILNGLGVLRGGPTHAKGAYGGKEKGLRTVQAGARREPRRAYPSWTRVPGEEERGDSPPL